MCNLAAAAEAADMQFTRRQIDRLKCATAENTSPPPPTNRTSL